MAAVLVNVVSITMRYTLLVIFSKGAKHIIIIYEKVSIRNDIVAEKVFKKIAFF